MVLPVRKNPSTFQVHIFRSFPLHAFFFPTTRALGPVSLCLRVLGLLKTQRLVIDGLAHSGRIGLPLAGTSS